VAKNPARRIVLRRCKGIQEIEPLTVAQVRALVENTEGRDRLIWRILLLTGVRIRELLVLRTSDLGPIGLCVDESSDRGHPSTTKNKKTRYAPIPDSLRGELEDFNKTVEGELIFPNAIGTMYSRSSPAIRDLLKAGRAAAGVAHLTFRHCRTTFATLFEGDPRDRQAILEHHSEEFTRRVYHLEARPRPTAGLRRRAGGGFDRQGGHHAGRRERLISSNCVQTGIDNKWFRCVSLYQRIQPFLLRAQ
jgi:integrase